MYALNLDTTYSELKAVLTGPSPSRAQESDPMLNFACWYMCRVKFYDVLSATNLVRYGSNSALSQTDGLSSEHHAYTIT